jgi:hypothetical protein
LRNHRTRAASPLPTQNYFSVFQQVVVNEHAGERTHAERLSPRAAVDLVLQELRSRGDRTDRLPLKIAFALVLRQLHSRWSRERRSRHRYRARKTQVIVHAFMSAINTGGSSSSVGWRTKVAKARELERRLAPLRCHPRTRARVRYLRRRALRRKLTPAGTVFRLQSRPNAQTTLSCPSRCSLLLLLLPLHAPRARDDLDITFVVDTGANGVIFGSTLAGSGRLAEFQETPGRHVNSNSHRDRVLRSAMLSGMFTCIGGFSVPVSLQGLVTPSSKWNILPPPLVPHVLRKRCH